jgi:hypothetical protein
MATGKMLMSVHVVSPDDQAKPEGWWELATSGKHIEFSGCGHFATGARIFASAGLE